MRTRTKTRKKNKRIVTRTSSKVKIILSLFLILLILIFFSTIFAIINIPNNKIISGVYINNVNISDKSNDEIKEYFNGILNEKKYNGIPVIYKEKEYTLELGLLEISTNLNSVIEQAVKLGRSGNVVKDNFEILKTLVFNQKYNLDIQYNTENLSTELNWVFNELPDKYKNLDFYVEENNLILSKPITGVIVNDELIKNEFEKYISDFSNSLDKIDLPFESKDAKEIDIKELHDKIYVEAKSAYYDKEPFKIYPEVKGIDFAISDEEITKILSTENESNEYSIPLKITLPEVTLANLKVNVFPDVLSKADGNYDVTNYNRANNLTLAGQKINEYVIAPGEVFSYNKVLGARTIAAGYKEAAIYVSGKIINGLGGGICQVSSILYNAVLKANLEVVERKCHQFLPSYSKPGLDATVAYGSIDFKFKNNRTFPIKIKTNISAGVAEIYIQGIKEDTDGVVTLENKVIETKDYEVQYLKNSTLEKDTKKLVQSGVDGKIVETYKIISNNAKEISRELISIDKYDVLNEIYEEN